MVVNELGKVIGNDSDSGVRIGEEKFAVDGKRGFSKDGLFIALKQLPLPQFNHKQGSLEYLYAHILHLPF